MKKIESYISKKIIIGVIAVIAVLFISSLIFGPQYRIYKQDLQGKANLRQQEWEKKILVEQAKAENESATLKAEAQLKLAEAQSQAEIIRAKGAAEANRIIGESLKNNEGYLRYLWITNLEKNSSEKIYIPTEANLPILEARSK